MGSRQYSLHFTSALTEEGYTIVPIEPDSQYTSPSPSGVTGHNIGRHDIYPAALEVANVETIETHV